MFTQDAEVYDLKLDQSCIFLREADSGDCVSGRFCVYLPRPASFKGIRVKLLGLLKVPLDVSLLHDNREFVTFESEQAIGSSRSLNSFQLPRGNYEFPFRIPLTYRMPETVTGPEHTYHSYNVHAIIERRFRRNSVVSRPIRIYRIPTLEAGYRMPSAPTAIEGQTPQDIQYSISVPDSNIPFGSKFPVKCWFAPLSKRLRLTAVKIAVIERHSIRVDPTAAESVMYGVLALTSTRSCTLFMEEHSYSRDRLSLENDESPAEWCLNVFVCLPDSFETGSQSISTKAIKITHELVVKAEFQDVNGLISAKVEEKVAFSIYMAPAAIGEDAIIHGQSIECFQENGDAPPSYGCHYSDTVHVEWAAQAGQVGMGIPQASTRCQGSCQAVDDVPFISDSDSTGPPAYGLCTSV